MFRMCTLINHYGLNKVTSALTLNLGLSSRHANNPPHVAGLFIIALGIITLSLRTDTVQSSLVVLKFIVWTSGQNH